MTIEQNSFGFWFVMLDGDPIGGGYLDKQSAIEEMEMMQ